MSDNQNERTRSPIEQLQAQIAAMSVIMEQNQQLLQQFGLSSPSAAVALPSNLASTPPSVAPPTNHYIPSVAFVGGQQQLEATLRTHPPPPYESRHRLASAIVLPDAVARHSKPFDFDPYFSPTHFPAEDDFGEFGHSEDDDFRHPRVSDPAEWDDKPSVWIPPARAHVKSHHRRYGDHKRDYHSRRYKRGHRGHESDDPGSSDYSDGYDGH